MSMRYYALYANAGWVLFDGCVDVGQDPKRIGIVDTQKSAADICEALNKVDGEAKAAWDAHNRPAPWKGVDFDAPGTKDRTTFSFDVETHAKRYFIGPGMDNALYGSATAIDSLRAKLNGRYHRIQELTKINTTLRANLKDAQAAADKFKAAANEIDGFTAAEWRNRYFGEVNNRREILAEYELCLEAAKSRGIGVMLVEHIKNLEKKVNGFELSEMSNYWKIQYDVIKVAYDALRKRILEL